MTKQSDNYSNQLETQIYPLEAARLELNRRLRASGRKVTEVTAQSPGQYIATIPQGRRPAPISYGAIISVEWGYELHSIQLSPEDWSKVKSGGSLTLEGEGYYYEAQFFQDYWRFGGGLAGSLYVDYGNDGANGFMGKLRNATIEELKA